MRYALLLSFGWAIIPALQALYNGQIIGTPYTDLYPSVWSLWAYWSSYTNLPHTLLLGYPEGSGWYPNSIIHAILSGPILVVCDLSQAYNFLLLFSRFATVFLSYLAAKKWGMKDPGALTVAAAYGCSPFFHGFAVEGILEGTNGWTLALWAWAAGNKNRPAMAVTMALTIIGNWYLGAVCCMLAAIGTLYERKIIWSFAGLLIASPFIYVFLQAFSDMQTLSPEIRQQMGFSFGIPAPNWFQPPSLFAKNNYIGWLLLGCALWSRSHITRWALIPFFLSLGWPLLYELPILQSLRFPYRWHAGTLILLAFAAGQCADKYNLRWLGYCICFENLAMSSLPIILPGSSPQPPAIYQNVDAPILDVPGPVALPPGKINRSRVRARYFLYGQTVHQHPIPLQPDFNALKVNNRSTWLQTWQSWDPLRKTKSTLPDQNDLKTLQVKKIGYLLIHHNELGQIKTEQLTNAVTKLGLYEVTCDGARCLYKIPSMEQADN